LEKSSKEVALLLFQQHRMNSRTKELAAERMSLIETVCGNYKRTTKKEVLQAREMRHAKAMLRIPSKKDFQGMESINLIPNWPITCSNITNAREIFGPDLASIHSKTVCQSPAPVVGDYVAVPWQLVVANKAVTLVADVFFVDDMAFLVVVSRKIKFVTVEHLQVRTATSLSKHVECVHLVYSHAGFRVRTILMDGEFGKIKMLMPTVECNTTAARKHLSKAKQTICTIKEQMQGLITTLPFQHILHRIKIKFIYFTVLWLNAFLVRTGILAMYLPRELLVRWQLDYKKHCGILPGAYCKVHNEPVPSNTMVVQTHTAIALGPTKNLQGGVKLFCLKMRQVLKCRSLTAMPVPTRIIK
jgi:hypothetical protein